MSLVGAGSPISKTSKKRCSSASRLISRSGSIREVDESIFAKLALAEFSERPKIVEFFGRWEAQQRAHCDRRTLSTGTVACTRLINDPLQFRRRGSGDREMQLF